MEDENIAWLEKNYDMILLRNLSENQIKILLDHFQNRTKNYIDIGADENDDLMGYIAHIESINDASNSDIIQFAILDFWPGQFILIVLYTVAALLSLTLNIITIIVWVYGERSQSTEIWQLLVNLSLADIGLAIFCIPFTYTNTMLQQWIFPHFLCPIVNFAQLCFVFVSVWTLTTISIDRYFAIVHPLNKMRFQKRFILILIWLSGILFASTQLLVSGTMPYMISNHQLYECVEIWSEKIQGQIYTITVFVMTFLIPVLIISLTYSTIWYHMMNHVTPGNPDQARDSHQMDVKNKIFKMLTILVGLFIVCWLPIHSFNLILYFAPNIMNIETETMYNVYYSSFFASHYLSMVHSLINPVVYCFVSENFR
ncbi:Neuropeptide Y receptor type 2-like protein, partial [Sarcoptes scabiei]